MRSRRLSSGWFLVLTLLAASASFAAEPASRAPALETRVAQLVRSFPGTVGVYARNLETNQEVGVNADELFPMASVYKVAIMVQVFREADAGRLSLDERMEMGEAQRRLGSGLLTYMAAGLRPTVRDLVLLMITISDNEATDILLERVGAANVTATLRALGLQDMRVDRPTAGLIGDWLSYAHEDFRGKSPAFLLANEKFFERITPERQEQANRAFVQDRRDVSSPRAMAELLAKIYGGEAASKKSCQEMLEILGRQQFRQRIPRELPAGARVAHKTGTIGYSVNDAGILTIGKQHVAVAIFTLKANTSVTSGEAEARIGAIARTIYDYFSYTAPPAE